MTEAVLAVSVDLKIFVWKHQTVRDFTRIFGWGDIWILFFLTAACVYNHLATFNIVVFNHTFVLTLCDC